MSDGVAGILKFYTNEEICADWYQYCIPFHCAKDDLCPTQPQSVGPDGFGHDFKTNQTLTVGGVAIPLNVTKRAFSIAGGETFPVSEGIRIEDGVNTVGTSSLAWLRMWGWFIDCAEKRYEDDGLSYD